MSWKAGTNLVNVSYLDGSTEIAEADKWDPCSSVKKEESPQIFLTPLPKVLFEDRTEVKILGVHEGKLNIRSREMHLIFKEVESELQKLKSMGIIYI